MKHLGIEISEDGRTVWRNNGGIIERKAMYAQNPAWETVAEPCPHTPQELRVFCANGGFGYQK